MGLLDKVRDVYSRNRSKGDLWAWAKKPRRAERRVSRWKALAEFANSQRALNRSLGRLVKAKAWTEARTVYRKKFRALKERIEERMPDSTDAIGFANPDRPWNSQRRNVPAWMVSWLEKSYEAGWRGIVVSGVRTPEYSEQLCYAMCGAPSCPGRCAGRASNHNMTADQGHPYGAVDVSDYYNFGAIQARIGSPLHNALGAQDPVHFSVSGR